MLEVGVIGLGNMGKIHMMNCLHVNDVKVVAAADSSKPALMKAKSFGVKNLYMDYHQMLENSSLDIDAVIISLPNNLHFESVQLALESGIDVFVEKPMANTVQECKEIRRLVEKHCRKLMVGYYMRFIGFIEKMKDFVDKSHLGSLEVATIEEVTNGPFSHPAVPRPVPEWWFNPEKTGGGVVLDLGSHLIDLFRFFAGDAEVKGCFLSYKFNLPVEDGAIIILNSSRTPTKGIINTGWYQKSSFPNLNFRMILHGNAGYLSSDLIRPNVYFHAGKEALKNILRKYSRKGIQPLSYSEIFEAYYKEMKHFFNCIKEDTDPMISSVDGLKTAEIIEEIYKRNLEMSRNA